MFYTYGTAGRKTDSKHTQDTEEEQTTYCVKAQPSSTKYEADVSSVPLPSFSSWSFTTQAQSEASSHTGKEAGRDRHRAPF